MGDSYDEELSYELLFLQHCALNTRLVARMGSTACLHVNKILPLLPWRLMQELAVFASLPLLRTIRTVGGIGSRSVSGYSDQV